MNFSELNLVVDSVNHTFTPYDRGANGAFVYREKGVQLHATRLVITTVTDDTKSDKYLVQLNKPRVIDAVVGGSEVKQALGTDLVKTELRFLATTSEADRKAQIDLQIAALQAFRETVADREHLYS